jgi:UDP-N-acetylmuramyl pentapeptide phosphotransferase/UDP-N-acetylglucosamine-1-phosphate transferase
MAHWDYQGLFIFVALLVLVYLWRRRNSQGPGPLRNPVYWIVIGIFFGLYFLIGIVIALHGP